MRECFGGLRGVSTHSRCWVLQKSHVAVGQQVGRVPVKSFGFLKLVLNTAQGFFWWEFTDSGHIAISSLDVLRTRVISGIWEKMKMGMGMGMETRCPR